MVVGVIRTEDERIEEKIAIIIDIYRVQFKMNIKSISVRKIKRVKETLELPDLVEIKVLL